MFAYPAAYARLDIDNRPLEPHFDDHISLRCGHLLPRPFYCNAVWRIYHDFLPLVFRGIDRSAIMVSAGDLAILKMMGININCGTIVPLGLERAKAYLIEGFPCINSFWTDRTNFLTDNARLINYVPENNHGC